MTEDELARLEALARNDGLSPSTSAKLIAALRAERIVSEALVSVVDGLRHELADLSDSLRNPDHLTYEKALEGEIRLNNKLIQQAADLKTLLARCLDDMGKIQPDPDLFTVVEKALK